jgi:ethylmalonyl-CoA mutase
MVGLRRGCQPEPVDEDVQVVGSSILWARTAPWSADVVDGLQREGVDVPVVAGGIIPPADAAKLHEAGAAAVFTPKDSELTEMLAEVAELAGATPQPA